MSETQAEAKSSPPDRDSILSIIGSLGGRPPAVKAPAAQPPTDADPEPQSDAVPDAEPIPELPAASMIQQARIEELTAALCDLAADRDAWREEAAALRAELASQLDGFRVERLARDSQISQLTEAISTLGQALQSRADAGSRVSRPEATRAPMPTTAAFTDGPAPMAIPALAPDTHRDPEVGTRIGMSKVKALPRPQS